MMFKKVLILSVALFLALSCSKQSAPELSEDVVRGREEQERLDACTNVNLNKNVLAYQNTVLLFKCTGWSKDFPSLFTSITKISAASWDQVFAPINESFINDQVRRDRFFKNIRELDQKNGLEDLSYVIVALNETNFFDSVRDMFKCVENPTLDLCKTRKNIPTKTSLKKILTLVDTNPESIAELAKFFKDLNSAIGNHQEELRTEINKFRVADKFGSVRLQLVDKLMLKIKTGLSDEDRVFLSKLLSVGNKTANRPWLYDWLHDEKLNRSKFRDLVEYPVLTNPNFIHDVRGIRELYNQGMNCTIKQTGSVNELIDFDLKNGIGDYLYIVKNNSYKEFYDYSSVHVTGLKASKEICKELESNAYNVSLINAATKVAEFFAEKKNYDLIRFILNNTTSTGDANKEFGENIYLGDFLANDLFSSLNEMNYVIAKSSREFFPVIYDVALSLPPESLINISNVLTELTKIENDPKFKGIADFWNFFSSEEKNFVFNFIDRHFDKGINYPLLFEFYSKFLDDISEAQPVFKEAWIGSDIKTENSYLALQDLFYNLSGTDNLKDLKKFFSRDQILKVLEVISSGQQIVADAKSELKYRDSTTYIQKAKQEKYKYNVVYGKDNDSSYNTKKIIECMQNFSQIENGFYEIVRNFPAACTAVTSENISFRLFGWMNFIEGDFNKFYPRKNNADSIFDNRGILSPYMLNTNIGLMKIADNIIGDYQSAEPTKDGIPYTLDSINFYLNNKNGIVELNKQIDLLVKYFNVKPNENTIYRNSLIKSYSKEENFAYSRNVFSNISDLVMDFGQWIKSGEYDKARTRSLGTYDPKNTCENTLNTFIDKTACPTRDDVKRIGKRILTTLQNTWEPEMGSPLRHIFAGAIMNGGLDIPLNRPKQMKYRLSLADNIKYLYDTSDRSASINNQVITFVNPDNVEKKVNLTVLERVETVIREVTFGNNYLGVSYLNHVVEGDDYNKDVTERKNLMKKCVNIPGIRCGRKMSDDDLRMAKNALEAYDALLDINNGRGLDKEKRLNYGNFLKAFQQTLIASSSKAAQEVTFLPLKDEVLKQHNGVFLGDVSFLGGFSNTARFIRDRIGRNRSDLDKFLAREDFKRVDRTLMNGFDLNRAVPSAERLVAKLLVAKTGEKQPLFDTTVDWVANLSYEESLLFEDTVARLMVVGSYLGTPDVVFNLQSKPEGFDRYKSNNLFLMFMALEKMIDYWPTLKNYFPADAKLIDAIKPVNTFLYYLTDRLNSTKDPAKNKTYIALNDLFLVLQTLMFDDVNDNRIIGKTNFSIKGIDLVVEGFKDSTLVTQTYETVRSLYKFTDNFFETKGQFFMTVGQNVKRLANNSRVDMTPIRDYLEFTSKNGVKVVGDSNPTPNYHYDEMANIVKYLNQKDENGKTYISVLNKKVFQENYKEIISTIEDILPALKIKSVKIPLANI